jgi:probable rRNA maturation factor
MSGQVDVTIDIEESGLSEERIARAVESVVRGEGRQSGDISIVLTGHEVVLDLNRQFLEHDYHTDVLAFPLSEDLDVVEGEVYVDVETARERHAEFGASFESEVLRYVIHGVLHLCGHDDSTDEGKHAMSVLEDRYLARVGET